MAISYLGSGKGKVTGKGVSISPTGRTSKEAEARSHVVTETALDLRKREDAEKFLKAKAEAEAQKKARAEELAARGGVPVSAAERVALAQQQASRYGVGVAQSKTPTTIVDESGRRTQITQSQVTQMQKDYFTGKTGGRAPEPRGYGKWVNKVGLQEQERQANKAAWQARQAAEQVERFRPYIEQSQFALKVGNLLEQKGLYTTNELQGGAGDVIRSIEAGKQNVSAPYGTKEWIEKKVNTTWKIPVGLKENELGDVRLGSGERDNFYISPTSDLVAYRERTPKEKAAFIAARVKGVAKVPYGFGKDVLIGAGQSWYKASHPKWAGGVPEPSEVPIVKLLKKIEKKQPAPTGYNVLGQKNLPIGETFEKTYAKLGEKGFTREQQTAAIAAGGGVVMLTPAAPVALAGFTVWGGYETQKKYREFAKTGDWSKFDEATGTALMTVLPLKKTVPEAIQWVKLKTLITEVPLTRITTPKVATGQQRFPYTPGQTPAQLQKSFYFNPFKLTPTPSAGYHSSPTPLKVGLFSRIGEVGESTSATPGIYIAPGASPHFLKISGEAPPKLSLLPKASLPTIQHMEVPVKTIPTGIVQQATKLPTRKESIQFMNEWLAKQPANKAYVSPEYYLGKQEAEAVIQPGSTYWKQWTQMSGKETVKTGTWLDRLRGFDVKTTVAGKEVPIVKLKVGEKPSAAPGVKTVKLTEQQYLKEVARMEEGQYKYVSPFDIYVPSSLLSYEKISGSVEKPSIRSPISSKKPVSETKIAPSKVIISEPKPSRPDRIIPSLSIPHPRKPSRPAPEPSKPTPYPETPPPKPPIIPPPKTPIMPPPERTRPLPKITIKPPTQPKKGYYVVMREFGKEVKVTAKPMTKTQAELMGRDIAKQSLSASYKVVPTYQAPLPQSMRKRWAVGEWVSPFRFTEGKSAALKGFKVEKPKFRIGGVGAKVELKESKKKKKGMFK